MRGCLAILLLTGCDAIWRLDPVVLDDAASDRPPDASSDAASDAATVLTCATSPITLLPTGLVQSVWTDQVPATGTHDDKVADDTADDDGSYIATMIDGQFDLYTHLPLDSSVKVDSVTFWVRARLDADVAQVVQVAPGWRLEGMNPGWDDVSLTTTWADHSSSTYTFLPDTTTSWSVDDVNAMALGVRKSYSERVRVTRVWATIACH